MESKTASQQASHTQLPSQTASKVDQKAATNKPLCNLDEPCDVAPEAPPTKEKPLPKYGEIYEKRMLRMTNKKAMVEAIALRKKQECNQQPLIEKCIPKELVLPFKKVPSSAGQYMEYTDIGFGKSVKGKVAFPGWLIELADTQLQGVLDAKELLATGKPLCDIYENVFKAISSLGSDLKKEDVVEILRRIPNTTSGWSFSHFMFTAGNPWYAKKKGVLQDPIPFAKEDCAPKKEGEDESETEKARKKKHKNVVDRLYQLPKLGEQDDWPPKEGKPPTNIAGETKEYSNNEKLFYSALLYCDMYDTMEEVQKLYTHGSSIPESRIKRLKREQRAGFGVSDIGTRKFGFAEWDRPLPPLPKISPYISEFPLVSRRLQYIQPSKKIRRYRRSVTFFQPLFLEVKPNELQEKKTSIRVQENAQRIKYILDLMSSQGNCLAMLPNVHFIFHLSDALLNKLHRQTNYKIDTLNHNNEVWEIMKAADSIYRPHTLPKEIKAIPERISYPDGLKLREICTQIRQQHWDYICSQKGLFREVAWERMHVGLIPCGNLRESFVYAFDTYLPEKSPLPVYSRKVIPNMRPEGERIDPMICNYNKC